MTSFLSTAIEAANAAGEIISVAAADITALKIEQKSLHDYVSEVDRNSEAAIKTIIESAFPNHAFLGEETGSSGSAQAEVKWIVDPLDGTTNFLRGIPHYAVSIAVMEGSTLTHGVVLDPAKSELFHASAGQGAYLNGHRIEVSNREGYKGSLLSTGIPFSGVLLDEIGSFSGAMEDLLAKHTSGIRRLGAAALDLAYVAAGRYDGFWEAKLKPWDIAAGVLLVQEAGGTVADFLGGQAYLESGDIVAASSNVINDMLEVTSQHYRR